MMLDTGITEGDLLTELARDILANQRQPGDVDAQQLAKATGLNVETCRKRLEKWVYQGKLLKVVLTGGRVVYRRNV